ncbi:MAG: hypothetical protein AAF502_04750 [Bacteroidota bacterium]
MKTKSLLSLLFGACLLWLGGCNPFANDISLDDWQPELAVPLFESSVNVVDLLEGFDELGEVQIDPDNLIRLVYKSDYYEVTSTELLTLVPQNTFVLWDTVRHYTLDLNNANIEEIRVKSGNLFYQVGHLTWSGVTVNLTVPQATKDGVVFNEDFPLTSFLTQGYFDLEGYSLRPTNDTVTFKYTARTANGTEFEFNNTFSLQFQDVEHTFVQGYLGTATYFVPRDSIEIDFFDFFLSGSAFFEDPVVEVIVDNSFGFPVRASVEILEAVRTDGSIIPIANLDLEEGIDFNYPSLNEIGQTKYTSFIFDKNNSNIENVIGQPISLVDYKATPWANPDGDSTIIGFVTDSSSMGFEVRADLPFYGRLNGFTVADTFDFDITDRDEINYAEFKLITENGFPTDVDMQLTFIDAEDQILDSLMINDSRILTAANVNSEGEVTQPQVKETFIRLEDSRLERIRLNARRIVVRTSISTLNGGDVSVPIYADYSVDYRVGLIAGVDPD